MREFLELIKPYGKHNLYTKIYDIDENGRVAVPDDAKWEVYVYQGDRSFVLSSGDVIALILNDRENRFWPVISFLTREEAIDLAMELLRRVGITRFAETLAEDHAEWFASTLYEIVKRVYRDAFLHGWKHAEEVIGVGGTYCED